MRMPALVFLGMLALAPAARGDAVSAQGGAAPESLFARLGRPARREAVESLVAEYRGQEPAALVRLAHALGVAGGPAALEGLVDLADRGDATVRSAVFRAAEGIGLRSDKLRGVVRWSLARRAAPDRAAAVAALGIAGDSRDVEDLLRIAEDPSESAQVRSAAFSALEHMSGESKPYRLERWKSWWSRVGREGPGNLAHALKAFEQDPEQRPVAAGILARSGWLRLGSVSQRVAVWLRDEDVEVRLAAARIAAALRCAELAAPLAAAWDAAGEGSPFQLGAKSALTTLGADALTSQPGR